VYAAGDEDGLETGVQAKEIKLTEAQLLGVVHPARLFITAKASDEGLDSTFELTVIFNAATVAEAEAEAAANTG